MFYQIWVFIKNDMYTGACIPESLIAKMGPVSLAKNFNTLEALSRQFPLKRYYSEYKQTLKAPVSVMTFDYTCILLPNNAHFNNIISLQNYRKIIESIPK